MTDSGRSVRCGMAEAEEVEGPLMQRAVAHPTELSLVVGPDAAEALQALPISPDLKQCRSRNCLPCWCPVISINGIEAGPVVSQGWRQASQ